MKTIAVFSQKGGSGKSTVAIHLAVAAGANGRVILIDADPQATVATWGANRAKTTPFIARVDPASIEELLIAAQAQGFDLAVVDCPPHAAAGTAALLRIADHIVIPAQPSMPDLAATQRSVILARATGKPYSFVVNRAPPRAPEVMQAVEALAAGGPVAPIVIGDRRAFARALTDGFAVTEFAAKGSKAVAEMLAYWHWLKQHIQEVEVWQTQAA